MFQRLCHMQPGSGIGLVGLGSVLLHQKECVMARALLQKGKFIVIRHFRILGIAMVLAMAIVAEYH